MPDSTPEPGTPEKSNSLTRRLAVQRPEETARKLIALEARVRELEEGLEGLCNWVLLNAKPENDIYDPYRQARALLEKSTEKGK